MESKSEPEKDEKDLLIERAIECQVILHDLVKKVRVIKEENVKLKAQNDLLSSYIKNLMKMSQIFQLAARKKEITKS